ncbi:MAG: hypothetical protein ACFFDK_16365 [Promethearchaeota archaeon]
MSSVEVKSFLTQKIKIKKKFSKDEFDFYHFFLEITDVHPDNVIFMPPYVFFFAENENYYKGKRKLKTVRKLLANKKVMIIKTEPTLIRLLFSLFPDTYIHDILLDIKENGTKQITIEFYFYEDRAIAVGRKGTYIKTINRIFNECIYLENKCTPIEIRCHSIN